MSDWPWSPQPKEQLAAFTQVGRGQTAPRSPAAKRPPAHSLGKEEALPLPLHPSPAGRATALPASSHRIEQLAAFRVSGWRTVRRGHWVNPRAKNTASRHGSEKRQRVHRLTLRFDDAEWTKLETRAGSLSKSAYVRRCTLGNTGPRARRRPIINGELLARANADLNRAGSNLNQVARALNSRESIVLSAIEAAAAELRVALEAVRRASDYGSEG